MELYSEKLVEEKRVWQDVLGTLVDIKPLPDYITPEIVKSLEDLGMGLRYIPALDIDLEPKNIIHRERYAGRAEKKISQLAYF